MFLHRLRVLVIHLLYLAYPVPLWMRLINIAAETNHKGIGSTIACTVWFIFHVALQLFICCNALKRRPNKILRITWCNVPMLTFVIFILPPYAFTLQHLYEVEGVVQKAILPKANHTLVEDIKDIEIPMMDYIMLQIAMVILLLAYMLYPLPKRAYVLGEYLAIAIEFMNAFDIMDMLSDIEFVIHYGLFWVVLYYVSLGTSTILLAFPIKIEDDIVNWPRNFFAWTMKVIEEIPDREDGGKCGCDPGGGRATAAEMDTNQKKSEINAEKVKQHDHNANQKKDLQRAQAHCCKSGGDGNVENASQSRKRTASTATVFSLTSLDISQSQSSSSTKFEFWKKTIKALFTILFTDVLFATIRLKIMIRENSGEYGFNMVVKNFVLALLHLLYLLKHGNQLCLMYCTGHF